MSRPRKRKGAGKGPSGSRRPRAPCKRLIRARGPEDMIGWPGTLPEDRMRAVARAQEDGEAPRDEQTQRDLAMLARAQECMGFSAERVPSTTAPIPAHLSNEREPLLNLNHLSQAAWMQDTVDTIGGVTTRLTDKGRSEERFVFKLMRHPDWTGHNATLPLLAGNNATILESREMPGHPGIVFAEPVEDGFAEGATSRIPEGPATELAKILRWHGVRQVRWQPQSEDQGFMRFIAR